MLRMLDVYLHHDFVGHLVQDEGGQMLFSYAERWLENPCAQALSHSLPLRVEQFTQKECTGFFGGLLPEEDVRERIAKKLGISANNDFSMLERIGGECAGAITFMPEGQDLPARDDTYRELSQKDLADLLETLPRRPLLAGEEGVRLSLAGAQDKLAVKVSGDVISVPLNGAPSTHILKPDNPHYPGLVFNELFCINLARAAGLNAAKSEIRTAGGKDFLLVERYDRKDGRRLHQEDFCQALGIPTQKKYQEEGGPSLKQCFDLLRETSTLPVIDLRRLLDAVIFNYLIGNNDAHGKNFSLLCHDDGTIRFAPLYDVICTAGYEGLSNKMAMKIGGEYNSDLVGLQHFERLADETGNNKQLVKERVGELAAVLEEKLANMADKTPAAKPLSGIIQKRCKLNHPGR